MNHLQYLFEQALRTQPATIHLLDGVIVLYKRFGSSQWQCRFRLENGSWFACSAASDQVAEASTRAIQIFHKIQQKNTSGEALRTRTFACLAQEELLALRTQLLKAKNRQSIRDHIYVLDHYLIPFFNIFVIINII